MKISELYDDQIVAVVNNKFGLKHGSIGKVFGYSNSTKLVTILINNQKYSGKPEYLIGICGG